MDERIRETNRQGWGLPPSPVHNGKQQLHSSGQEIFQLKLMPDVDDRHADSNGIPSVPGDAADPRGAIARPKEYGARKESAAHPPAVPESPQPAAEHADRILGTVRSSKVEKPSKSQASGPKRRLRNHRYRTNKPGQTLDSTQNGTLLPPRIDTDDSIPKNQKAAPGKRTRTTAQPPLRPSQPTPTNSDSKTKANRRLPANLNTSTSSPHHPKRPTFLEDNTALPLNPSHRSRSAHHHEEAHGSPRSKRLEDEEEDLSKDTKRARRANANASAAVLLSTE